MITDDMADSILIFPPSFGTFSTDITVPKGASSILFGEFAAVVDDGVALVAGKADSFGSIELTAEVGHLTADSLIVEVVALRAFSTLVFVPGFASVMIGYSNNIAEGNTRSSWVEATEVSIE